MDPTQMLEEVTDRVMVIALINSIFEVFSQLVDHNWRTFIT